MRLAQRRRVPIGRIFNLGDRDNYTRPSFQWMGVILSCSMYCKKGIIVDMPWSVEFLDQRVQSLLDALPLDMRASFQRIVELIQAHGLERVREPYVKHLEGPLWEMRMKGRDGIARAVYVT